MWLMPTNNGISADHAVVPVAVPDAPAAVVHVTRVTPTLSLAPPRTAIAAALVSVLLPDGVVTVTAGAVRSGLAGGSAGGVVGGVGVGFDGGGAGAGGVGPAGVGEAGVGEGGVGEAGFDGGTSGGVAPVVCGRVAYNWRTAAMSPAARVVDRR